MAVLLAYLAFVCLGLPDAVLGVAWPSLRMTFRLPQSAMGAVLSAHVAGYLVAGLLAGRGAAALGVGGLLALSTGLVAAGLAGFALAPAWPAFLACAVIVGLGSGAIDAVLNAYAAARLPPRHMNWLHACYGLGATLGPAAMTAALAGASFRTGYAALSAVLAVMALSFLVTRGLWGVGAGGGPAPSGAGEALRLPRVWLQIGVFFAYTGLEAAAGQWAFTVLRGARGFSVEAAGAWTAAYWGSIAAGRVALGFVAGRLGPDRLVRAGTLGALAGAALYALLPGAGGAAGLVLLGASLAPVFPMLMSRTPERLGAGIAAHAIGFQVAAAALGTAALPGAYGALADALGPGAIPGGLVALAAVVAALCAALPGGRR